MDRIRRSLAAKIALVVGVPSSVLAILVMEWLRLPPRAGWSAGLLVVGICAAYGFALHKLLHRSLGKLVVAIERAERGDFLPRATVDSQDEIGELARRFNGMLARITDLRVNEIESRRDMQLLEDKVRLSEQLEAQRQQTDESNRRLQARVRDLKLLSDLSLSINSTLETDELLRRIAEMVGLSLDVRELAILLVDAPTGELEVRETFGFTKETDPRGVRFRVGEGVSGRAVQESEIQLVRDTSQEPRYTHYKGRGIPGADSFLAVPLKFKEEVVGVLNMTRSGVDAFRSEEVGLVAAVGNQCALALANARLHQATVELSLTDPLTGTANRRDLFARLELEVTRAQRFGNDLSLIMIDVDHFKDYNDRNGHPAGDEVLKGIAAALTRTVRKVDTVARYGGEEFAILLPQIRREEALAVAEKVRRSVEQIEFPHARLQPGGRVTISVGLAHYPTDAQDLSQLLKRSDAALYAAKSGGRNRVVAYSLGMRPKPVPAAPEPERQQRTSSQPLEKAG
ncbi:MAG: GGDEF domain-containing protein [Deltaproteobacteria bacterium]